MKWIRHKIERIWGKILGPQKGNDERYAWYVRRVKWSEKCFSKLETHYNTKAEQTADDTKKIVICVYDGYIQMQGLADRLRGILSTYYLCKCLQIDFCLVFRHPFLLQDYLVPNEYDWQKYSNLLRYDIPRKNILILFTGRQGPYEKRRQEKWLKKHLKKSKGQIHVYTNAFFSYDNDYHSLFNELFRPSERLQKAITYHLEKLKGGYISVSCRFRNLLGDFNETKGCDNKLTLTEKERLLSSVLEQIALLHQQHPRKTILCNSDSKTFLHSASCLDYTYVIPGIVTHIDANDLPNRDYLFYEKTFLDFFMIAHAEHIYTLKTGKMYETGFPYAASFIYQRPYDIIVF